jgi:kumamolisin
MSGLKRIGWTRNYWMIIMFVFLAACSSTSNTPAPTPTSTTVTFAPINLGISTAVLNSPVVGPLDPNTGMQVLVQFKLNQQQQSQFKKVTTNQQNLEKNANQIGITDAQYNQVKNYLDKQNVTLHLDKLHTSVEIDGKAQAIGHIFQTSFVNHKYQNRVVFTPKTSPLLPKQIIPLISSITGLDNFSPPLHTGLSVSPLHSGNVTTSAPDCSVPSIEDAPQTVGDAYGYNQFINRGYTGKGITINLVEIDGFSASDAAHYGACVGYQGKITVKTIGPAPTQPGEESMLDVDMIEGLAPGANIVDYQTGDSSYLPQELQRLIDDNANNAGSGSIVSISLGGAENLDSLSDMKSLDQQFKVLTNVEHMTVFVASGDCAAFTDGVFNSLSVSFPASDPNVVAVGGTQLQVDQNNHVSEMGWTEPNPDVTQCNNDWGSGGGSSNFYPKPSWQRGSGVNNQYSRGYRQVPDVSAVALNLPLYFEGQWQINPDGTGVGGGTSAATPTWAAGMALLNQALIKNYHIFWAGPDTFYQIEASKGKYHPYIDITSGNNDAFKATPGWDFVTGLGAPDLPEIYGVLSAAASSK